MVSSRRETRIPFVIVQALKVVDILEVNSETFAALGRACRIGKPLYGALLEYSLAMLRVILRVDI